MGSHSFTKTSRTEHIVIGYVILIGINSFSFFAFSSCSFDILVFFLTDLLNLFSRQKRVLTIARWNSFSSFHDMLHVFVSTQLCLCLICTVLLSTRTRCQRNCQGSFFLSFSTRARLLRWSSAWCRTHIYMSSSSCSPCFIWLWVRQRCPITLMCAHVLHWTTSLVLFFVF